MQTARHHAFDNLRACVIFLVVVLHGSMSYMAYAPQWWYVLDPGNSLLFTALVLLIDVPIMLIMFFLAGYFAYPSLARRGALRFLADKALRIGLPWVFGVLVLAPPTAYMIYFSRNVPMSLATFWRTDFWGKAFQQSVYWYLGVLFVMFAALALVYARSRRFAAWTQRPARPGGGTLLLFVLGMSAAAWLICAGFSLTVDSWFHVYVLSFQPARVPLYLGYFALGVYANRNDWFGEQGYMPARGLWTALCLLAGIAYLACRLGGAAAMPPAVGSVVTVLLFNAFCFTALLASIAQCCAGLDRASAFWRSQARNSYGVYYLHPLILYPLALFLVGVPVSIYLKAPVLIVLGYLATWGVSAALLTRLPGLRRVF